MDPPNIRSFPLFLVQLGFVANFVRTQVFLGFVGQTTLFSAFVLSSSTLMYFGCTFGRFALAGSADDTPISPSGKSAECCDSGLFHTGYVM